MRPPEDIEALENLGIGIWMFMWSSMTLTILTDANIAEACSTSPTGMEYCRIVPLRRDPDD